MVAYGATLLNVLYSIIPITIILYIIPFKDILARAWWHMGQPLLNVFYSVIPITIIFYIIPFKDILARAWWHLRQPLLNVFLQYYSYYNNIIILFLSKDILANGMVASGANPPKRFL